MRRANGWLLLGGALSLFASLLHLATIVGGPAWYRAFGAPEPLVAAAARGEWMPALVTLAIAGVLAGFAAYAFSGAGLIRRLPLLRTGLAAITAVYLLRGAIIVPALTVAGMGSTFTIVSSLVVLGFGLVYLAGTVRAWPALSRKERFA